MALVNENSINNTVNGFHAIHAKDYEMLTVLVATGGLYVNCWDKHVN